MKTLEKMFKEILKNSWKVDMLGQVTNFRFENGREVADLPSKFDGEYCLEELLKAVEDYYRKNNEKVLKGHFEGNNKMVVDSVVKDKFLSNLREK